MQNDQAPPTNYWKIPQDLNQGAGGTYNYLCIQQNGSGRRVVDITIKSFEQAYKEDYFG